MPKSSTKGGPIKNSKEIGLKELRMRLGWTQAEMAWRLGCDVRFIRQWETQGHCPQDIFIRKIERLVQAADDNAWRLRQEPLNEQTMADEGLSQMRLKASGF